MATKKRRHPRARARGLSVLLTGPGGVNPCSVEDISLGGVFIRTPEQLLPGTELDITLVRPGMRKGLKVRSRVTNMRTPGPGRQAGLGVRFEVLSDETRSRLVSMLGEYGVANPVEREEEASDPLPAEPQPPAPAAGPVLGTPFLRSYDAAALESEEHSASQSSLELDGGMLHHRGLGRAAPVSSAPGLMDRLQQELRTLLLKLGAAEQRVATQGAELQALRLRVAELEKTLAKQDLELVQLRAQARP